MKSVGLKGQYVCFAAGTWIGSIVAGYVEQQVRELVSSPRELPFELMVALYVPFSLLLALPFLMWIMIRARGRESVAATAWLIPFAFGLVYFPLLFSAIPMLIYVTGQGQGTLISSCIATLVFGLPIVGAEIAFRIGRQKCASGSNR